MLSFSWHCLQLEFFFKKCFPISITDWICGRQNLKVNNCNPHLDDWFLKFYFSKKSLPDCAFAYKWRCFCLSTIKTHSFYPSIFCSLNGITRIRKKRGHISGARFSWPLLLSYKYPKSVSSYFRTFILLLARQRSSWIIKGNNQLFFFFFVLNVHTVQALSDT